jgi:hypothetical protein
MFCWQNVFQFFFKILICGYQNGQYKEWSAVQEGLEKRTHGDFLLQPDAQEGPTQMELRL